MSLIVKNPTDPTYLARGAIEFGPVAAGNGGVTLKFVTFAALQLFSLNTYMQTAGTATYSGVVKAQQINLIVVQNTSGTSIALATTTYGPYVCGDPFATGTAAIGGANQFVLNTNTGTPGFGGVPVPQGALVYCVSGTDATAVTNCTVDYAVAFQAPVTQ